MAALADLQPDRRAVLQLLVGRGRGYDQIAELLQLSELVVRRRAHDAITTLAGGKGDIDDTQRALLCDYLVGELPASRRAEARTLLAEDAGARRFARGAAARLSSIPGAQLPELPAEDEEVAEAFDALDKRRERREELEKESKLGAWLIVAGIAAVVVIAVVLLAFLVGDESDSGTNRIAGPDDGPTQTQTDAGGSTPRNTIVAKLTPPSGGSASGEAALQKSDSSSVVNLAANAKGLRPPEKLADGRFTAYAFWLDGPEVAPKRLGFYDATEAEATRAGLEAGEIELGAPLNGQNAPAIEWADLDPYTTIFISRETLRSAQDVPSSPGPIVLTGRLETITA